MEMAISPKISVTFVRMVMFVQLLDKATTLCLPHHVLQVGGVVQALQLIPLLLFVLQAISVQLVQLCKYPVPQAGIILVSAPPNQPVPFANWGSIANFGTLYLQGKLHKSSIAQ